MATRTSAIAAALLSLALILGGGLSSGAAAQVPDEEGAIGRIPARLSYTNGQVSFWRPGASAWATAQINTPLAPGDELYAGAQGTLEVQVGPRAFLRAWGDAEIGLLSQQPTFLQIKVVTGHATLDLRSLDPGYAVEVDTPQAAFTIEHAGYYRVEVTQGQTAFITRRGGRATMTLAGGQMTAIAPSEEVVLQGSAPVMAQSYVAPEIDAWDRWNYSRSDELLDAISARYVPWGAYGVDDLDHYGTWRVVPTYGAVWFPQAVPAGWAPYSTGRWIWDPDYGWTWVDTAPWGWAPYHYGRWVSVNGFWGWAPGPLVERPVYAPALVAFFGAPGTPFVSWVALGWGEPVVPWWGKAGFIGRPWWAGWGGPRIVNNAAIGRTTVVNAATIRSYRNMSVPNAVVGIQEDQFGRASGHEVRMGQAELRSLEPLRGAPHVRPEASSFVAAGGRGVSPSQSVLTRPVVTRRLSTGLPAVRQDEGKAGLPAGRVAPQPAAVAPTPAPASRPPFGTGRTERSARPQLPAPPREEGSRVTGASPGTGHGTVQHATGGSAAPHPQTTAAPAPQHQQHQAAPSQGRSVSQPAAQPAPSRQVGATHREGRSLPGEPANRLFPGRAETHSGQSRAATPKQSPQGHQGGGTQQRGTQPQNQR